MIIDSDSVIEALKSIEKAHGEIQKARNNVLDAKESLDSKINVYGFQGINDSLNTSLSNCETIINKCNDFIDRANENFDKIRKMSLKESLSTLSIYTGKKVEDLSNRDVLQLGRGPLNQDFLNSPELYVQREKTKAELEKMGFSKHDINRVINGEITPEDLYEEITSEFRNGKTERYEALKANQHLQKNYYSYEQTQSELDKLNKQKEGLQAQYNNLTKPAGGMTYSEEQTQITKQIHDIDMQIIELTNILNQYGEANINFSNMQELDEAIDLCNKQILTYLDKINEINKEMNYGKSLQVVLENIDYNSLSYEEAMKTIVAYRYTDESGVERYEFNLANYISTGIEGEVTFGELYGNSEEIQKLFVSKNGEYVVDDDYFNELWKKASITSSENSKLHEKLRTLYEQLNAIAKKRSVYNSLKNNVLGLVEYEATYIEKYSLEKDFEEKSQYSRDYSILNDYNKRNEIYDRLCNTQLELGELSGEEHAKLSELSYQKEQLELEYNNLKEKASTTSDYQELNRLKERIRLLEIEIGTVTQNNYKEYSGLVISYFLNASKNPEDDNYVHDGYAGTLAYPDIAMMGTTSNYKEMAINFCEKWRYVMSDEEIGTFNYICNTEGYAKGYEHLEKIAPTLDKRYVQMKLEIAEKYAHNNHFLASIGSVLYKPIEGISGAFYSLGCVLNGTKIWRSNIYSVADTWRSTVSNDISIINGKFAGFIYNTGMSMADSGLVIALTLATGGTCSFIFSTGVMGSSVYLSTLNEALDRGLDDKKAVILALGCAAAESLLENYSLSHLFKLEKTYAEVLTKGGLMSIIDNKIAGLGVSEGTKTFLRNFMAFSYTMFSQAFVEGEEEFSTEIVDQLWGMLVAGDLSKRELAVRKYKETHPGCSDSEAYANEFISFMEDCALAFAGGFTSGLFYGGVAGGKTVKQYNYFDSYNRYLNNVLTPINMELASVSHLTEAQPNLFEQSNIQHEDIWSVAEQIQKLKIDLPNNNSTSDIQIIDVSQIDTERQNKDLTARGVDPNLMNMSYKGYDFVYKTHGDAANVINQVISENKGGKLLIELDSTVGLTEENLSLLPDNVEIRVLGDYDFDNLKNFRSNAEPLHSLENVTYTVSQLKEIMQVIFDFEKGVNPNWNDATKAKYAYDYMQQIRYRGKNQDGVNGNAFRASHFDGLTNLLVRKSTCQGFAHTYKELLTRMGIPCFEISGQLGGEGMHAFNVVTIDGENILVDTTRNKFGEYYEDLVNYPDRIDHPILNLTEEQQKDNLNKANEKNNEYQGTGFGVQNIDQYTFKSNVELKSTLVTMQTVNLKKAARKIRQIMTSNRFLIGHNVLAELEIFKGIKTSNTERAQSLQSWAKDTALSKINEFFNGIIDLSKINVENIILLETKEFQELGLDDGTEGINNGIQSIIEIPESSINSIVYERIIHELLHQVSSPEYNYFLDASDKLVHYISGFDERTKKRRKRDFNSPYEGFNEAVTDYFASLIVPEVSNSEYSCAYFNAVQNLQKILSLNIDGFNLETLKNGYLTNDISKIRIAVDSVAGEGFFENELCPAFNQSIQNRDENTKLEEVVSKLEALKNSQNQSTHQKVRTLQELSPILQDDGYVILGHGTGRSTDVVIPQILEQGLRVKNNNLFDTAIGLDTSNLSNLQEKLDNWPHFDSNKIVLIRLPMEYITSMNLDDTGGSKFRAFYNEVIQEDGKVQFYLDSKFIVGIYDRQTNTVQMNDNFEEKLSAESIEKLKLQYEIQMRENEETKAKLNEGLSHMGEENSHELQELSDNLGNFDFDKSTFDENWWDEEVEWEATGEDQNVDIQNFKTSLGDAISDVSINDDGTFSVTTKYGEILTVTQDALNSQNLEYEIKQLNEKHEALLVDDWLLNHVENIRKLLLRDKDSSRGSSQEQLDRFFEREAEKMHIDPILLKTEYANALKRVVDNSDIGIRVSNSSLLKILESGVIKNIHEVESNRLSNSEQRKAEEEYLMGIPTQVDGSDSPIYGMLFPKFDLSDENAVQFYKLGPGSWYGADSQYGTTESVVIFKKDNVINQTTITLGDSLEFGGMYSSTDIKAPTSASDPIYTGNNSGDMMTLEELKHADLYSFSPVDAHDTDGYIEAQIYGRYNHSIDNIDHVIFLKTPSVEVINKLNELGIKYIIADGDKSLDAISQHNSENIEKNAANDPNNEKIKPFIESGLVNKAIENGLTNILDSEFIAEFSQEEIEILLSDKIGTYKYRDDIGVINTIIANKNYKLLHDYLDYALAFGKHYEFDAEDVSKKSIFDTTGIFGAPIDRGIYLFYRYLLSNDYIEKRAKSPFFNETWTRFDINESICVDEYDKLISLYDSVIRLQNQGIRLESFMSENATLMQVGSLVKHNHVLSGEIVEQILQLMKGKDIFVLEKQALNSIYKIIQEDYNHKIKKGFNNIKAPSRNVKGIEVFDITNEDYAMLVHVINKSGRKEGITNQIFDNPLMWNNISDGNPNLSSSIISQDNIYVFGKGLIFGFYNLDGYGVIAATKRDAGSDSSIKININMETLERTELFDELTKKADSYNEVILPRYNDKGEAIQPNYVVCFDEIDDVSLKAAQDFGIPIYVIHKNRVEQINSLLISTFELNNDENQKAKSINSVSMNLFEILGLSLTIKQNDTNLVYSYSVDDGRSLIFEIKDGRLFRNSSGYRVKTEKQIETIVKVLKLNGYKVNAAYDTAMLYYDSEDYTGTILRLTSPDGVRFTLELPILNSPYSTSDINPFINEQILNILEENGIDKVVSEEEYYHNTLINDKISKWIEIQSAIIEFKNYMHKKYMHDVIRDVLPNNDGTLTVITKYGQKIAVTGKRELYHSEELEAKILKSNEEYESLVLDDWDFPTDETMV